MKAIEVNIKGIKCDNASCDYKDDGVRFGDYLEWLNKPCPECGENLLTQKDYETTKLIIQISEVINAQVGDVPEALKGDLIDVVLDGSGVPRFIPAAEGVE